MRHTSVVATAVLLSAALFSSCTCHKDVGEPPPSSFQAPPSGFHASGVKITPQTHVEPVMITPPAEAPTAQVAQAMPTPPGGIPADFPKDVPIFKDAALAGVQDLANNARNVLFNTTSPVPDVFSFYQDRMTHSGWVVTQQFQRQQHAFLSFKKGNMIANLTVAEDAQNPGHQVIAIMYEEEKPLEFDEF